MLTLFINFIACATFRQDIDHTNDNDGILGKFDQRYSAFVERNNFSSIIIYICGLYSLDECITPHKTNTIRQIANRTDSDIFFLEHRFCGKSLPFQDLSPNSLEYLTIDQIVDDVGAFTNYLKKYKCHDQNCRILLAGDGYGGSIAVWTKRQYPELIDSVWAISAPLLASNNHFSEETFHTSILNEYFPDCLGTVSINMRTVGDQFFSNNETFINETYQYFNITSEMFPINGNVLYAISNLIYDLIDLWMSTDIDPLRNFCSNLNKNNFFSNARSALYNLSKNLVDYNPTWPTNPVDETKRYKHLKSFLDCNELGWIPVSTPLDSIKRILPFKIKTNYVSDNICVPLFNKTLQDKSYFNLKHGGSKSGVQSVIYTNAIRGRNQQLLYDTTSDIDNDRKEIMLLNYSDWDISANEPQGVDDSPELINARNTVLTTLTEWLSIDKKCKRGRVYLHNCVCNDRYAGKYCDSLARSKEYESLSTVSVIVPTFMMLSIGLIAWFVFVVSSKTTKLIC